MLLSLFVLSHSPTPFITQTVSKDLLSALYQTRSEQPDSYLTLNPQFFSFAYNCIHTHSNSTLETGNHFKTYISPFILSSLFLELF